MLEIGSKAPQFVLESTKGIIDLNKQLSKILIIFYPRNNTSGCTKQLRAAQDSIDQYRDLGVSVIAINPGSLESHHRFADKYGFEFPLRYDANKEVAKTYRVLTDEGKISRTVYILDDKKIICYAKKGRPETEELLEVINSIK